MNRAKFANNAEISQAHAGTDSWWRRYIASLRYSLHVIMPMYSSGTVTETFMMGSRMAGFAFLQASLKAMEPAILNAISEESTSW